MPSRGCERDFVGMGSGEVSLPQRFAWLSVDQVE